MSTPTDPARAAERHYQRTGHKYQVRTARGRLVASAMHLEHVEFRVHEGLDRQFWKRVESFGRAHWI